MQDLSLWMSDRGGNKKRGISAAGLDARVDGGASDMVKRGGGTGLEEQVFGGDPHSYSSICHCLNERFQK